MKNSTSAINIYKKEPYHSSISFISSSIYASLFIKKYTMDEEERERYFNSLSTQVHHSNHNVYESATVLPPDDDSCTESEQSVRVTVVPNCK